jgi:hypothetical protein
LKSLSQTHAVSAGKSLFSEKFLLPDHRLAPSMNRADTLPATIGRKETYDGGNKTSTRYQSAVRLADKNGYSGAHHSLDFPAWIRLACEK